MRINVQHDKHNDAFIIYMCFACLGAHILKSSGSWTTTTTTLYSYSLFEINLVRSTRFSLRKGWEKKKKRLHTNIELFETFGILLFFFLYQCITIGMNSVSNAYTFKKKIIQNVNCRKIFHSPCHYLFINIILVSFSASYSLFFFFFLLCLLHYWQCL